MQLLVVVIHLLTAVSLVVLVLLQQGKGAEMGASFGSGGSNTVFGSAGGLSFFAKLTAGLAVLFFVTSVTLAVLARNATPVAAVSDLPFSVEQAAPGTLDSVPASDVPQAPANGVESAPGDVPELPAQ